MYSSDKHPPPASFAPSPPLSTDAGPSDCELDLDRTPSLEPVPNTTRSRPPRQPRRRRQARLPTRIDSSPASIKSNTSFASDIKQETGAATKLGEGPRERGDLDTAFALIRAYAQGTLPDNLPCPEWHVLHLSPPEYRELLRRVEDHGLGHEGGHKFRHDYNPQSCVLVLRMVAKSTHEVLQQLLFDEIKYQLRDDTRAAEDDPVLAQLLSNVEPRGQMEVVLEAQYEQDVFGVKSPDAQLWAWHEGTSSPQFVMEVGYTQKNKDLPSIAMQYYEGSDGKIKTVLTMKIAYSTPDQRQTCGPPTLEQASADRPTFSLYRGPQRVHHDQAFRTANGTPAEDVSLQLLLSDFLPDAALEGLSEARRTRLHETKINLPAPLLCQFLAKAERAQADEDIRKKAWQKRREEWEVRRRQGNLPTMKRKTVAWDLPDPQEHDADEATAGTSEEERPSRSKRQRTGTSEDSSYRGPSVPRRASAVSTRSTSRPRSPDRRRTRSMSRGQQ